MSIPIGQYKTLQSCRFCQSDITEVIRLGDRFPLAGGFLRNLVKDIPKERVYPLSLSMCQKCCLIQCTQVVHSDILFKQGYFYYSSMIPMLVKHFSNYAKHLSTLFKPDKTTVVEIGCNDGVFLRPLKNLGFTVIGVDPSDTVKQLVEDGFEIYNEYFDIDVCDKILDKHGKIDLFLSSNSFAHIDDMRTIMKCMKSILKPDGYAVIEVHYLKAIIDDLNFDFIYHEHMSYYSITSLYYISKLFDMTIMDVEFTNIHGSSIRVYFKNNVSFLPETVQNIIKKEEYLGQLDTFLNYSKRLNTWRNDFMSLYNSLLTAGNVIYGYGSSGRANTFCNFCDIQFKYIIDDSISKIGNHTPVYHSLIVSSNVLKSDKPDYVVILAWSYAKDIIEKNREYLNDGGKFIIPLPKIEIISYE